MLGDVIAQMMLVKGHVCEDIMSSELILFESPNLNLVL